MKPYQCRSNPPAAGRDELIEPKKHDNSWFWGVDLSPLVCYNLHRRYLFILDVEFFEQ